MEQKNTPGQPGRKDKMKESTGQHGRLGSGLEGKMRGSYEDRAQEAEEQWKGWERRRPLTVFLFIIVLVLSITLLLPV